MRMNVRAALLAGVVVMTVAGLLVPTTATAQSSARGVTDTTVKVAGLGFAEQLGDGSQPGAATQTRPLLSNAVPQGSPPPKGR